MAWTRQQKEIIDARNCNLLVSAAAGSGKTAVLVERIVQMVLDEEHPIDLDQILVVTFTKAAASQMRERIEKKLEEELAKQPANEHLLKQISLIHRAQITTIHSFCMDTVKNYFYQLSLDPNFRIGEEGEMALLKQEVLEEILEEQYSEPTEQFLVLVESYAPGKTDKVIEELILKIYEFCISSPRPKQWLLEAKNGFLVENERELEQSNWMKNLIKNAKKQLRECEQNLLYALSDSSILTLKVEEILKKELNIIKEALKKERYQECKEILDKIAFPRWPVLTKKEKEAGYTKEQLEPIKEIRDNAKKIVQDIREKFFFYGMREQFEQIKKVAPTVEAMIDLVIDFYDRFQEKKREKNVFEFHDLEHFALELFVDEYEENGDEIIAKPSEIALELRKHYREIFIDEYQDSNMVQELLLTTISEERTKGNLFMVGDMKQSIYKFRMARPEIFQNKYERYEEGQVRDKKIELRNNFRSRWEVLEAVNYIFYQTMQEDFAKMTYGEKNRLVPSRQFPDWNEDRNITEVFLLNMEKKEADLENDEVDETEEDYTKLELEAKIVAKRIKELVEGEKEFFVEDDRNSGQKRKVKYEDIAILLRTMQGTAEVFEEVLSEEGIPVHMDSSKSSFHATEIKTAISLLEIIDNVYLDIPLVAVLRSPIVAVTAEELAMIRNLVVHEKRSSYSFYEYLEFYLETGSDEKLKQKLSGFLDILGELREEKTYLSIEDLIWSSFEKTGYYQYVKGMSNGERRQANLDMLMQKAAKYEETSYRGLFQFIRYIRQLDNYEEEFGLSTGLVEDDAVRIMSIHKSKGLEFPVVFVSNLSKKFNYMDINQKIVLHQDYYIGVDNIDYINREKTPTLQKKFLQEQLKIEMLQEELRVLYVALTRAKEKLILTATVKGLMSFIKKPFGSPSHRKKGLSYLTMMRGKSFIEWILPALCNEKCTDKIFSDYAIEKEGNISYIDEEKNLFSIHVISPQKIVMQKVEKVLGEEITKEELLKTKWKGEKAEKEKIYNQFKYQYPNQDAIEARGKWSVSELKRAMPEDDEDRQANQLVSWEDSQLDEGINFDIDIEEDSFVKTVPSFIQEKEELLSVARGTAVHKILELLDFSKIDSRRSLEEQMEKLLQSGQIDEREYQAGKKTYLYSLWNSEIGRRMTKAAKKGYLHKERQFMIGMPMREIELDKDSEEFVLIQGIIDLYFEEEDGIVIIDYKTDFIPEGEEAAWISRYKTQLLYYKRALEQMTGKKVKETYLYAFSRRKFYEIKK
ncbi:MAG: helicase-exonuclease AddAB subunit AddA [Lachnospiraceae bacterium]